MFIVSGSNARGLVSSDHATLEEAIAKASDFIRSGMGHVGILDMDRRTYTEREIDLLIEMAKVEQKNAAKRA